MLTRMGRGFLYFDNELKSNLRLNRNNNNEHLQKKRRAEKKSDFYQCFRQTKRNVVRSHLELKKKTLYSFLVFHFGSYKGLLSNHVAQRTHSSK